VGTQSKLFNLIQLDNQLAKLKALAQTPRPRSGWLKTIRKTLGLSAKQLGKRLNISQSAVAQIEKNEAEGKATLESMNKLASALNCQFVYALIPHASLKDSVDQQAVKVATQHVLGTARSMSLEDQGTSDAQSQLQIRMIADDLKTRMPGSMWETNDD